MHAREGGGAGGEPGGGRVAFRFESWGLKYKSLSVPLPPVGAGYFEVLYIDDELRVCKDSRGDLQVCTRGKGAP